MSKRSGRTNIPKEIRISFLRNITKQEQEDIQNNIADIFANMIREKSRNPDLKRTI